MVRKFEKFKGRLPHVLRQPAIRLCAQAGAEATYHDRGAGVQIILTEEQNTENQPTQPQEPCSAHPTSEKTYEADGQKCLVIRHFTGDAPLSKIVLEVAVRRIDREMGL